MVGLKWPDLIEISLLWAGIYVLLRSLKGTRGLGVLRGSIGILVFLYLAGRVLALLGFPVDRLLFLIESLVTVALTGLIVLFQPELRRGLTRLGERPLSWLSGPVVGTESVSPIARAAGNMSRRRIGALVVLERSVGISGIVESGVQLSADVTAPLLESIFYPNAPMHDGAVVVRGGRVVAAKCLLPLSDTTDLGAELGTRHRAAVGVTEETDAIVVVVSEQTGRISVAHHGRIRPMRDTRELESTISTILGGGKLDGDERASGSATSTSTTETKAIHRPTSAERAAERERERTVILEKPRVVDAKADDAAGEDGSGSGPGKKGGARTGADR